MLKVVSWNLNGMMPVLKAGGFSPIEALEPDVLCLQEIRTLERPEVLPGHHHYYFPAERKGLWGTALISKREPRSVELGLGERRFDAEGRLITAEFDSCYVVCVYTPNSQKNLARRQFRVEWDEAFEEHLRRLAEHKPVIAAGDYNVAVTDADIYEGNRHHGEEEVGWASDERDGLLSLLEDGFIDAFRLIHPEARGDFTWWAMRRGRRAVNHGWRLDYFIVSESARYYVKEVIHHHEIEGSDHCPIELKTVLP